MILRKYLAIAAIAGAFALTGYRDDAQACSRAVYLGPDSQIITGRTMDWLEDMHTNLWVFPRGLPRDAGLNGKGETWTSKFGSVIASAYDGGTVDGMNEKGLVANLLFLASTTYPSAENDARPVMPVSAWTQYALDNFSTVAEAVEALGKEEFRVAVVATPNGKAGFVHLSISDASGDSAILQYIDGKLVIHHSRNYQVMTNDPPFRDQLALDAYWKRIGGLVALPGTIKAEDRFVRASFYINAVTQTSASREAVAAVFSVMRNVSVPRGIAKPGSPNLSQTIWLTVADQKNLVYYFQDTYSPSLLWVRLGDIDFSPQAGVRKLQLDGNPDVEGDKTAGFVKAQPFTFLTGE